MDIKGVGIGVTRGGGIGNGNYQGNSTYENYCGGSGYKIYQGGGGEYEKYQAIEVPVVFTYALASINAAPRDEDYMGWNKVLAPIIDVGGSLE
ncbi:hypothetical protein L2E82_40567 [Cichorium intybus]|uniref:Uncharacterized protein n=1 Tax=Cichorium intybus TaxID=13427 RepID=A0ACB9ALQ6_CICIN|nr:hypothetical protein L2E82_40567 [Cichorium intybus]